ncbi:dethiobiotin synthase [Thalassoroseus pseudoceratinae]|uniref:dethiobiotin synthase n=1 Tax=Thalassoroseus pseudoceratinae TaxID=2713176 RepID=UPI00141D7C34|nr:dethiobiotin synthase [Thalassoroseus pseudoceratinae]
MTRGLFITGTDTGVGKTFVTTRIAQELQTAGVSVGIYKPACSGVEANEAGEPMWEDVDAHFHALDGVFPRERICPQCFHAPLAPPVAALAEGRCVDADLLRSGADWWRGRVDVLLIEGAGGLLCPMTESTTIADVAADLAFPLLIVARLGLGTINHTLLTVEVARSRGLPITGIVLNDHPPQSDDPATKTNPEEIARRSNVPVFGVVGSGMLESELGLGVDWNAII